MDRGASRDRDERELDEAIESPTGEGAPPRAGAEPSADGADPDGGAAPEDDTAARLAASIDRLQRLQAEFENYRRRSREDLREREERTVADVFRRFLPVIDDLRLAARAEEGSPGGVTEGLRIILDKIAALLAEFSIEEIAAIGESFDPRWHEALVHSESETVPPGVVLDELERGYRLGERLVRPARVVVAKAPPADGE